MFAFQDWFHFQQAAVWDDHMAPDHIYGKNGELLWVKAERRGVRGVSVTI